MHYYDLIVIKNMLHVMVNISTNINKVNNAYNIKSLNKEKTTTYDTRNPGHGLGS